MGGNQRGTVYGFGLKCSFGTSTHGKLRIEFEETHLHKIFVKHKPHSPFRLSSSIATMVAGGPPLASLQSKDRK